MFFCLTASTARALLCTADEEFRLQVMVEAVVACPEFEHCQLLHRVTTILNYCHAMSSLLTGSQKSVEHSSDLYKLK